MVPIQTINNYGALGVGLFETMVDFLDRQGTLENGNVRLKKSVYFDIEGLQILLDFFGSLLPNEQTPQLANAAFITEKLPAILCVANQLCLCAIRTIRIGGVDTFYVLHNREAGSAQGIRQ